MLFRRAVVAQDKVEFIEIAAAAGNQRNRIVRRTIRLSEDFTLGSLYLRHLSRIFSAGLQVPHGPHPADESSTSAASRPTLMFSKAWEGVRFLNGGLGHGKRVAAAPDNGHATGWSRRQSAGPHWAEEVMRENRDKVHEVLKALARNLHRYVLAVQDYTMFIIIRIRRILQEPAMCREAQRNQAVRLAGRMTGMTGITLVLTAEQAFRIARRWCQFCFRDIARVLLRLGEVNRDIEVAIFRSRLPDDVLVDAVFADVVRGNAHLVELIRRCLRAARAHQR